MQRELSSSLFDVERAVDSAVRPKQAVALTYDVEEVLMGLTPGLQTPEVHTPSQGSAKAKELAPSSHPYWPEEMRRMRDEIQGIRETTKTALEDIKRSVADSLRASSEANHAQGLRIDEIQKGWQVRDEQLADWVERVLERLKHFEERLSQNAMSERKVDEMVQRHQEMVRSFENRLVHFQRVMAQQELMIHQLRESLLNVRRP